MMNRRGFLKSISGLAATPFLRRVLPASAMAIGVDPAFDGDITSIAVISAGSGYMTGPVVEFDQPIELATVRIFAGALAASIYEISPTMQMLLQKEPPCRKAAGH